VTPWATVDLRDGEDPSVNDDWRRFCDVVNKNTMERNDMSWLPTHVKEPESTGGNYLKIGEGETVNVRIIGTWEKGFIEGWEVWEEVDGKPVPRRYRDKSAIPAGDYRDKPRYFLGWLDHA